MLVGFVLYLPVGSDCGGVDGGGSHGCGSFGVMVFAAVMVLMAVVVVGGTSQSAPEYSPSTVNNKL